MVGLEPEGASAEPDLRETQVNLDPPVPWEKEEQEDQRDQEDRPEIPD